MFQPQPPRRFVRKAASATKPKSETGSGDRARKRIENDFDTKSEGGSTPDVSKLGSREREISSLNDLYSKAKEELQKSSERCNTLEESIKTDKEIIARLEQEKTDLKNELDRIMEELTKSSEEYKAAVEKCSLLDANLAERKAAVEELEQTKTELLLDMEDLKKRAERNAEEIEEVSHRCLELESELAESVALNSRLEKDRAERQSEVTALKEQIEALSKDISAKSEQCAALESGELNLVLEVERKVMVIDEMTKEMKLRDECIYQLENNLAACRADLSSRISENESLRSRQAEMEKEVCGLAAELADSLKKCAALEEDKARLGEAVAALEKTKEYLAHCSDNLLRDLEEMHAAVLQSNQALEEAQTRVATELLEKDKLSEEVGLLSGRIERLEQEVAKKQLVISQLEADLSACNAEIDECRAEAARQLEEFNTEIENIKDAHDTKMSEVQQALEKNVAVCEARVSQAQAEHECELAKLRNLAYKLEQKVLDEREGQQRLQRALDEERQAAEEDATEKEKEIVHCRNDLIETRNILVNVENALKELDKQHVDAALRHKEELDEAYRKVAAAEQALWEERQKAQASIEFFTRESEAKMLQIQRAAEEAARDAEEKLRRTEEKHNEKLRQIETSTEELLKKTRGEATLQLEQLKAESEVKVREAEAEVSSILMKLSEAEEQLRILSSERDGLRTADLERQMEMVELQDRVFVMETELAESRRKHKAALKELEQVQAELEVMKRLKRNLELIGNETLATVNAVGQRLLDREVEVERLTRLNLALEEHYNEERKNISVVESECLRQVEDIRISLLERLEEFRQKGVDEINMLQERLAETSELLDYYKEELQATNNKLEMREAEIEEQCAQMNVMQDSMDCLNSKLDVLAGKVTELDLLKESHSALEQQLKNLHVELEQARREAVDAETEIQARERQIVDLTALLDDISDKLRRAEEERAEEQEAAKREIEDLLLAKEDLKSQLDALNTLSECHKMNVVKATQRIETLQGLVHKKESQLSEMSKDMDEVAEELTSAQMKIEDLKEQLDLKKDAVSSLNIQLSDLKITLEESEKKAADLVAERDFEKTCRKDSEQQIADMYEELIDRDRKIQDSKETVSSLESEICDKKLVIASLEAQLSEANERISILKDESEDSLKQITDAEQVIVVLQASKASLEQQVADLQEKSLKQTDVIADHEEQLKSLTLQLESERDAVKYLKSRIEVNHNDLQAAERTKMTLESEIGSLKMQLEMLQMDMDEVVRNKDAALKEREDKVAVLEEELKSLKLDAESVKASFQEKENSLRDEVAELKELLERKGIEATENAENLKKRVHDLESEMEGVTRRKEMYKAAVVELQQLAKQNKSNIVNLESDLATTRTERDDALR